MADTPATNATHEPESSLPTRRAAIAGVAALIAGAAVKVSERPAEAQDEQKPLLLGGDNASSIPTFWDWSGEEGPALQLVDTAGSGALRLSQPDAPTITPTAPLTVEGAHLGAVLLGGGLHSRGTLTITNVAAGVVSAAPLGIFTDTVTFGSVGFVGDQLGRLLTISNTRVSAGIGAFSDDPEVAGVVAANLAGDGLAGRFLGKTQFDGPVCYAGVFSVPVEARSREFRIDSPSLSPGDFVWGTFDRDPGRPVRISHVHVTEGAATVGLTVATKQATIFTAVHFKPFHPASRG